MWKHSILLMMSMALVLGGTAYGKYNPLSDPALIGWWACDEGEGSTVSDSSPNGYHGEFINGSPAWTTGVYGMAIELVNPTLVEIPAIGVTLDAGTWAGWILPDGGQADWSSFFMHRGPGPASGFNLTAGNQLAYHWNDASNTWSYRSGVVPPDGEWSHAAVTVTPDLATFYLNGVESATNSVSHPPIAWDGPFWIGGDDTYGGSRSMTSAALDDLAFFGRALTAEEVLDIMGGLFDPALASAPSPADGATDVPRDDDLSWNAGEGATSRDVYFGTSFDDVNDGVGTLVSPGQAATSYDPGRLEFGQTYYWRIDEIGGPEGTMKGDVWSFEVEPFAYPVENVTVTANTTSEGDAVPEKMIDGSGLNEADQHSVDAADMWLGVPGADVPMIEFEFDQVYKLDQMVVWNYNVMFELMLGFGLKDVTVEYSADGTEWVVLGDVEFAQATARADYEANTAVDFGGVAVKAVRLTVNSGYGPLGQFGLSEVRFTYIPVQAREPQPADGDTGVSVATDLSWRAGRQAASHEVSLGTDPNALALIDTTDDTSVTPGTLDLETTYYWQVVEVNEAESISTWAGAVWSFAAQEFLVVDDFESYTDDEGSRIYESWLDGWVNDTGSTVGYFEAPFAETSIVSSGSQAMPLFYDNAGVSTAEAELTLSQDWTASGIKSLAIAFHGAAGNTGQLYIKINNTKIAFDGNPGAIATPVWQVWNIDLSTAGNVSNVTKLTIGIEGAGATGVLYVDDIRLYAKTPEVIVPVVPDDANLVAYYAFEGNANDSSGNGFNGTIDGSPNYVPGKDGQAIALDGVQDHVIVESVGISGADARTIAGWAKADTTSIPAWTDVFGFTGPASNGQHFDIEAVGSTGTTTLGYYGLHRHGWEQDIMPIDLEWHHLAATFDGTTVTWYGDGLLIGSEDVTNVNTPGAFHVGKRQDNVNVFPGAVDEVRVYDRALSPAEVAGLAGLTAPIYVPF
ncbi:MAG: hypothetical protein JSW27_24475 [Phycisphaerales bacterium]|nr:MAG: hypothetical protein JSW27_24475 [Phycisphaerales bacterium]